MKLYNFEYYCHTTEDNVTWVTCSAKDEPQLPANTIYCEGLIMDGLKIVSTDNDFNNLDCNNFVAYEAHGKDNCLQSLYKVAQENGFTLTNGVN